jgi:CRP-like cAMP-binding protein
VREGEQGKDIFLLLDGMLRVDVAGQTVAELGPGAVVGERAVLEGGRRTSTLTALTPCRVALASAGDLEEEVLRELSASHRREDEAPC